MRYAARGYVYPALRAVKAAADAAAVDAAPGEEMTAPMTDDNGYQHL